MQRMMDVNFMGTFYGARAALPAFRAQSSGHIIIYVLDRRTARHRANECLQRHQGRAGRVSRKCLRAEFAGTDIHVSRRLPGIERRRSSAQAMERDFGHSVSGLGPKQSVDEVARAVVACIRRPRPEVYPHALSRGLAILNAVAPGWSPTGWCGSTAVDALRDATELLWGSETFADPGFAICLSRLARVVFAWDARAAAP